MEFIGAPVADATSDVHSLLGIVNFCNLSFVYNHILILELLGERHRDLDIHWLIVIGRDEQLNIERPAFFPGSVLLEEQREF